MALKSFKTAIDIIGINPFVFVPDRVLAAIFMQAQSDKGPIPVRGTIEGHAFIQTLVKHKGYWRLYINSPMLKASGKKVGDSVKLQLEYDAKERVTPLHPKLAKAFQQSKKAKQVFDALPPSRRKEIMRYINSLKTEESVDKNVKRAINFLLGKNSFVGQEKPN
jgi:uncharacterized protein YdeI (YjbR/CyaY-like superfamily)